MLLEKIKLEPSIACNPLDQDWRKNDSLQLNVQEAFRAEKFWGFLKRGKKQTWIFLVLIRILNF